MSVRGDSGSEADRAPITASYLWTPDEAGLAAGHLLRVGLGWRRWWLLGIGTLLLASGAFILATDGVTTPALFNVSLGALMAGSLWIGPALAKRQHRKNPLVDRRVTYLFDEEGATSEVEGQTRGERRWGAFTRVVRVKGGFLLYPQANIAEWIPNGAFDPPESAGRFVELAARWAPRYEDRS